MSTLFYKFKRKKETHTKIKAQWEKVKNKTGQQPSHV